MNTTAARISPAGNTMDPESVVAWLTNVISSMRRSAAMQGRPQANNQSSAGIRFMQGQTRRSGVWFEAKLLIHRASMYKAGHGARQRPGRRIRHAAGTGHPLGG